MYLFFFISIIITCLSCNGPKEIDVVASLPRTLAEASGIAKFPNNPTIFVLTDHGNPNSIYGINTKGKITTEINIANIENADWEDMATDGKSKLFIGDFGNNNNDRKNITIYTVENFNKTFKSIDTMTAKRTTFTLPDQKKYPPNKDDFNYDIESLIYANGFFYVFTRNRSKHFNGKTKMYRIPVNYGHVKAELIGDVTLCEDKNECYVTGSTLSPDGKTLILLTSSSLYKFTGFINDNFLEGTMEQISLKHSSKKEGICYKDNSTVYIVDERRAQKGGKLYSYTFLN